MKWFEVPVTKYWELLIEAAGQEFADGILGPVPFFPTESEIKVINVIRWEESEKRIRDFKRHQESATVSTSEHIKSCLSFKQNYRYEKAYISNHFRPISYNRNQENGRDEVLDELAHDLATWDLGQYLIGELKTIEGVSEIKSGLRWKEKPAVLAHVIMELVDKAYLEPPRRDDGEINHSALANIIKDFFCISGSNVVDLRCSSHNLI